MIIKKCELINHASRKLNVQEPHDVLKQSQDAGLVITKDSVYEYDMDCIKRPKGCRQ